MCVRPFSQNRLRDIAHGVDSNPRRKIVTYEPTARHRWHVPAGYGSRCELIVAGRGSALRSRGASYQAVVDSVEETVLNALMANATQRDRDGNRAAPLYDNDRRVRLFTENGLLL